MTFDSQRSLSRLTLENLKLRRLEDEGETYEAVKPDPRDVETVTDMPCVNNLNLSSNYQNEHNRSVNKSALTYWRQDETSYNPESEKAKSYNQYQNLDKPGMGLELECLTSFMTVANKNRIISNFLSNKSSSK